MGNHPDKRLSNYPADISEEGLKELWLAVIQQAIEDLENGGMPVNGAETGNMKLSRQLEAYHWLFSERSDLAFEMQGVYCENFREQIRTRLKAQGWVLPQGAVTKISTEIGAKQRTYSD